MGLTPWRKPTRSVEVDQSVFFTEATTVPGGAPGSGKGKVWVRDDATTVVVFTDSAGTDTVLGLSRPFTATKTGSYTASSNEHVKYDVSGPTFTLTMPSSPSTNDQVGIKNVTTSITAITLSGNGNNVEDPFSAGSMSSSVSVTGAGVSLIYQYDGTAWWIV